MVVGAVLKLNEFLLSAPSSYLRKTQSRRINQRSQVRVVDPRMRCCRNGRLCAERHSEACFPEHGEVVGAVADRQGFVAGEPVALPQFYQGGELRLAAQDRLLDTPR